MNYLLIILLLICPAAIAEEKKQYVYIDDEKSDCTPTSQCQCRINDLECSCYFKGKDTVVTVECKTGNWGVMVELDDNEEKKSKRSEYIDKCDEFLEALPKYPIQGSDLRNDSLKHGTNAKIAVAYCTRALLEER